MSCQKLGRTPTSLCNNSSVLISAAGAGRGAGEVCCASGCCIPGQGVPASLQRPEVGASALAAGHRGAGGVGSLGREDAGSFALLLDLEAVVAATAAPVPEERAAAGLGALEELSGREGAAGPCVLWLQAGGCKRVAWHGVEMHPMTRLVHRAGSLPACSLLPNHHPPPKKKTPNTQPSLACSSPCVTLLSPTPAPSGPARDGHNINQVMALKPQPCPLPGLGSPRGHPSLVL